MKKIICLFVLLFSFSSFAGLIIPTNFILNDYNKDNLLDGTAENLVITNQFGDGAQAIDIGTLSSPYFKMNSVGCTCSLLERRTCGVSISLRGQPRLPFDYTLTDTLRINNQDVTVSATVKALVPSLLDENNKQFYVYPTGLTYLDDVSSINFGTITTVTTLSYKIQNSSSRHQKINFQIPLGMTIASTSTCVDGGVLNRNLTCNLDLTLEPTVCSGNSYSEVFHIIGTHNRNSISISADFTGATSPLCIP